MNWKNLLSGFSKIRGKGLKKVAMSATRYLEIEALQKFPSLAKSFSPRPTQVFLEPTNHCNLHCKMCTRGARKAGFMDYVLFTRLIDEIAAIGDVNLILHVGGESLVHPKILDMLEYVMVRSNRLRRVGFNTNGTLLNAKVQEKLVNLGVDWLGISLDGLGKVNDEIRIGSDYDQIEANIRALLDKRGSAPKPEVGLYLTDIGQCKIDEFIDAWISSVDYIRVCACLNNRVQIINPQFFNGHKTETKDHCISPCSTMAIFWNGDVVACCANINGIGVLGNVADKHILEVWKGAKYRQLRYDLLTGNPKGLCFSCNSWKTSFSSYTEKCGNYQIIFYDIMKRYERKKRQE